MTNTEYAGKKVVADDDKTLTKWIFRNDLEIKIQAGANCYLETTLNNDWTGFIAQCMRWERAKWRGNLSVMKNEDYWYKKHCWTCFAIYIMNFISPAILCDGTMLSLLRYHCRMTAYTSGTTWLVMLTLGTWICVLSKLVKLIGHWRRHPEDLKLQFVVAAVAFPYFHGIISVWARLTLDEMGWSGQPNTNDGEKYSLQKQTGLSWTHVSDGFEEAW